VLYEHKGYNIEWESDYVLQVLYIVMLALRVRVNLYRYEKCAYSWGGLNWERIRIYRSCNLPHIQQ